MNPVDEVCPCESGRMFRACHGRLGPEPSLDRHAVQSNGAPATNAADAVSIPTGHVAVPAVLESMQGLGFERVKTLPGSTWHDSSTLIIVPTREPFIHHRVVTAWQGLIAPMNQKRGMWMCVADEVGIAYNRMINDILANPDLSKWKYILTLEADNLPPPDAHIRLLESIESNRYDAVGGIYWTKGEIQQPMAYGDPAEYARTGLLDFRPLDIRAALAAGNQIVECSGLAMGCTLYRMELFRQVPQPWFVTVADLVEGKGPMGFTQDLYFARTAKAMGKRFAVDLRVKVGHLDLNTGVVY